MPRQYPRTRARKAKAAPEMPARSNKGGATRGKARAAQVKAMNAARRTAPATARARSSMAIPASVPATSKLRSYSTATLNIAPLLGPTTGDGTNPPGMTGGRRAGNAVPARR